MLSGLFKTFGMRSKRNTLLSPLAGRVIPLSEVNDHIFAAGLLGQGVAIEPSGNHVVAPSDSKIEAIFPTGHAVALHTNEGMDVLIHVGLDTDRLDGKYFHVCTAIGQNVKKGQVLIEFDRQAIKDAGFDVTAPILICNSVEFSSIKGNVGSTVSELDELITARER